MLEEQEDNFEFNSDIEFEQGLTIQEFLTKAKLPEYSRKTIRYPTLIKMLAASADETKTKIRHILHHLAAIIEYELRKGNSVQLEGIGILSFKPAQKLEFYNPNTDEEYEAYRNAGCSIRQDYYMKQATNCWNDGTAVDWDSTKPEEFFVANFYYDLYLKELDKIKQREEARALAEALKQSEKAKGIYLGD